MASASRSQTEHAQSSDGLREPAAFIQNGAGVPEIFHRRRLGVGFKLADALVPNAAVVLQALKLQGEVNIVSQPRLRTVNNQTAIIKVGTDRPFFSRATFFIPSSTIGGIPATTTTTEDTFQTITVGTILSITPQISTNHWISLDISPVITSLVEERVSPGGTTTAPVLDIKQASTMVRVKSDESIVIGGLIQKTSEKALRKVPFLGDIPILGKAFQGKFESKEKKELVIFLTPHIVD